ncbi:hypothetical protein TrST_g14258 [Triparma strigata]|uniref:Uncharacterized protein n=1 Tax=Triparma strigata TaxID=1606541 RepID=A0A9W7F4N6_9STRA|nr:hypothetical protein TrST_g14258 [Triparma strigata]
MKSARQRLPSGRTNLANAGSTSLEFSPIKSVRVHPQPVSGTERTQSSLFTKGEGKTFRSRQDMLKTRRAVHTDAVSLTGSPKMLRQIAREMERSDFDNSESLLTERSLELAKKTVARQFFSTLDSRGQLKDMRAGLENRSQNDNVDLMINSDYTRSLRALKYRQRVIEGKGSRQMKGCLSYETIPDFDPEYLESQKSQYKPYTQPYETNSAVRTYSELKMRRIRENIEVGEVWRQKTKGVPEGVSFRRVSAFKLDNGDIDR